jgi:hypothetical protein
MAYARRAARLEAMVGRGWAAGSYRQPREITMRKAFEIGGFLTAAVLIIFGVVAIAMGAQGRNTVQSSLQQEQITGTPDMTPSGIAAEAKQAGLPDTITLPTCTVAGQAVTTGSQARCFASYMRIHALEATGGLTYSQMPRYATADGKGTNDAATAQKDAHGQPVDNPARQVWISEIALSGALDTSYMADRIALFGIVVGIALVLTGIGFAVLTLGGALRNPESYASRAFGHHEASAVTPATPS